MQILLIKTNIYLKSVLEVVLFLDSDERVLKSISNAFLKITTITGDGYSESKQTLWSC